MASPAIVMGPLELEGSTLGERQRHFNKLVNDAIKNKVTFEDIKDLEEKSDIDKLFKIDIASHSRNVEYILEVLKSEDILHVSRAIKQSSWLITDPQYAHIVNPQYLNQILFPHMMTKASNKFLREIRKSLKDEERVEKFYKYYEENDYKSALKWLPNCSIPTIANSMKTCNVKNTNYLSSWSKIHDDERRRKIKYYYNDRYYDNKMRIELFKRLCRKSISILEAFNDYNRRSWYKRDYINSVKFMLPTNIEKFLDIAEGIWNEDCWDDYCVPSLGKKYTDLVMKTRPERVLNKFELYAMAIHIPTFFKYLGKENIKDFLMKQIKNLDYMGGHFKEWFRYNNINKFIKLMPKERKFDFVKKYFIDKEVVADNPDDFDTIVRLRSGRYPEAIVVARPPKFDYVYESVYQWYKLALFDVAFSELKKLIITESSPEERINIFSAMLSCAGNNMSHIQTVLMYYQNIHINESFKFKMQFMNILLLKTNIHRYNENCWRTLNQIFHSFEVYTETQNCLDNCVEAVILYNVLHDETVPEIIQKKLNSDSTFKNKLHKLGEEEKTKLFKHLYNNLHKNLNHQTATNQDEISAVVQIINKMLNLLFDWGKDLENFPDVIDKIKQIIYLKKENFWKTNTSSLYKRKTWRKHLFEESILISPSEAVCLNALKHDPELLKRHKKEVEEIFLNEKLSLQRFFAKLRIYWPSSLGKEWAEAYTERLQKSGNHKAVVRALCTLLPRDVLIDIFRKYGLDNSVTNRTEDEELLLSIRKNIAQSMHWMRPRPPLEAVFWLTKGAYSHFALPSLCAIFDSMSADQSREHILKLIDESSGVFQKCGIRLAFTKLKIEQKIELPIFFKILKVTRNESIRAEIFQLIHKWLCEKNCLGKFEESLQLLEMFMGTLIDDDDKFLFSLLGKVDSTTFNMQSFKKSYTFLQTLPVKADSEKFVNKLLNETANFIDRIDPDIVEDILQKNTKRVIQEKISNNYIQKLYVAYIISGDSEETQLQRYKMVLLPILQKYYLRWKIRFINKTKTKDLKVTNISEKKSKTNDLKIQLNAFGCESLDYVLKKKILPIKTFKAIQIEIDNAYAGNEYYGLVTFWKLKTIFLECATKVLPTMESEEHDWQGYKTVSNDEFWKGLWMLVAPEFGKECIQTLKKDIDLHGRSIYTSFTYALDDFMGMLNAKISDLDMLKMDICEALLFDKEFIIGHLIAIKMIPTHCDCKNKTNECKFDRIVKFLRDQPSYEVKAHYLTVFIVERFKNVLELLKGDIH